MNPEATHKLLMRAAERYSVAGRWALGFARGKLRHDPAYRTVGELLPPQGDLLDLGCGEGYLLAYASLLQPALRLTGVDHDARRLRIGEQALQAQRDIRWVRGDLLDFELPASDVITCLDVLHYLPPADQDRLLARMAEALRPGGLLIIRDAHRDAGIRSLITWACEKLAVAAGRHKGRGVFFRHANELSGVLRSLGLQVQTQACQQGTPLANQLLVARREGME